MKKSNFIVSAVLTIVLFLGTHSALALEPIPAESGFSGFIRPGVGYLNFKSNMVSSFLRFDLSDKKIDSLTDSPDSQSNGIAMVPFSLEYTFASTQTQLFLGTDLTDLVRFDYSQQIGVKQGIGRFGILQGGFLFSGIPAKVWKDPYVVNQRRDDTDRDSMGAKLVWDRIFGSHFQVQYTYRNIDIDTEQSGEFLGLTPAQRRLLDRNGDTHSAEILYRIPFSGKHVLTPAFSYTYDDRDGGAMRNNGYNFQVTYAYFGDPITLTTNAFIGWADYDDRNPIPAFDKKQNDDSYGIQGTVYYKNPWDWSLFGSAPMNFFVSAAFAKTDANIDFYDQEAFMTSAGVFFKW